jgi:hypothetical protein
MNIGMCPCPDVTQALISALLEFIVQGAVGAPIAGPESRSYGRGQGAAANRAMNGRGETI